MSINKKDLRRYRELEKQMARLFVVFGELCKDCFLYSREALESRARVDANDLCCCMCDNQVHDYWTLLDPVQRLQKGPQWTKSLPDEVIEIERRRIPGNGPCKALTPRGCAIPSHRPPTCTTQLCPRMIHVLYQVGLIPRDSDTALQLEDILGYGDLFDRLYGLKKGEVSEAEFQNAINLIQDLGQRLRQVDHGLLEKVIHDQMRNR